MNAVSTIKLGELARKIDAVLRGDSEKLVRGIGTLLNATPDQVSFLANKYYRRQLSETRSAAVIVCRELSPECPGNALITEDPYLGYARAAALFAPSEQARQGIHPSAVVDPEAEVHPSAYVGPQCVVESGSRLAAGVFVGPGCIIGRGSEVGAASQLVARVTLCHGVRLGKRVLVHPGAVIGSDGFGLARENGCWIKIAQLGSVLIGDDVEIGANTTIDRGAVDDTVIEQGVKLDNQIQVGHNVSIGAHTAIAGCVGIAGSTRIGNHCTVAGGAGFAGHLEIGNGAHVAMMTSVHRSLDEGEACASGTLAEPVTRWRRNCARFRRLDQLARRLIALERRVARQEDDK